MIDIELWAGNYNMFGCLLYVYNHRSGTSDTENVRLIRLQDSEIKKNSGGAANETDHVLAITYWRILRIALLGRVKYYTRL